MALASLQSICTTMRNDWQRTWRMQGPTAADFPNTTTLLVVQNYWFLGSLDASVALTLLFNSLLTVLNFGLINHPKLGSSSG